MLHTNLATRPFYNARAIRSLLVLVALVALGLTAFNVVRVLQLTARNRELGAQAEQAEKVTRDVRSKERAVRQSLDRTQIDAMQAAAREANTLIDRRAFSWTDLFNRFEQTLPPDVRISAVTPQADSDGRLMVAVVIVARRSEDVEEFSTALEATGAFQGVLTRDESPQEDGTLRSVLQSYYSPSTVPPPPASESPAPPPGNATPATADGRAPGNASSDADRPPGGAR